MSKPKVALVELTDNVNESFRKAIELIGGIDDLNTSRRVVTVKVGVFQPESGQHTTVNVLGAIVESFNKAPRILIAESDNYKGKALERLQIWKKLCNERVALFSLSDDDETKEAKAADEKLRLSHVLFKPNVLVSTHVLRTYNRGSVLKNLLGLVPDHKKVRFHKKLEPTLADMYEAVGGIDLAVMDGTYLWHGFGSGPTRMNLLIVGRDAVAVETVGATIAGLRPEKVPIIMEFAERGFGKSSIEDTQVVGLPLDRVLEKSAEILKTAKKRSKGAKTWSGRMHDAMKSLVNEGFFRLPNKRTAEEVAQALNTKGIPTEGKEEKVGDFLSAKVKKGILKKEKNLDGWVYWAENS